MISIRTTSTAIAAAAALVGTAVPAAAAAGPAAAPAAGAPQDFNGDGYADLVVGAPAGTVSGKATAGYVAVAYGSATGLAATRRTLIDRSTSGIPGSAATNERFGYTSCSGDLDGDGYTDLVITSLGHAGSVITWGGPSGLTGGTAVPNYSSYCATGDFDGDHHTDLALVDTAIAQGDDPVGSREVLWKGPVTRAGVPASATPVGGSLDHSDDVRAMTAGDTDGDGRADLVLTTYTGDGGYTTDLYRGTATGLAGPVVHPADLQEVGGLTTGDLDHDGYADLLVGDPAGESVTAVYGSATGMTATSRRTVITQDTPGVPGSTEYDDGFGYAVATGDVDGDGYADVAIGNPWEAIGDVIQAGYTTVVRGGPGGVTGQGAQAFSQDTAGVPGMVESGDWFGGQVALQDLDGNGHADLESAAPFEDGYNGAFWVLRGQASGITTTGAVVLGPKGMNLPATGASLGRHLH